MMEPKFDVACAVVRNKDDKWLLIQRGMNANSFPLQWALPGGKPIELDFDTHQRIETAVECAVRELEEETGWQAKTWDECVLYEEIQVPTGLLTPDNYVRTKTVRFAILLVNSCVDGRSDKAEVETGSGEIAGMGWFEAGEALILRPIEPARKLLLGSQAIWARQLERIMGASRLSSKSSMKVDSEGRKHYKIRADPTKIFPGESDD